MTESDICALVIDNEPESLKQTTELLESFHSVSKVKGAANSDEALFRIMECTPDIVLFEYPAKGNMGNELLQFIKTKLNGTTIIYVSESKRYAVKALQDGIFNFLVKPISADKLEKIIRKALLLKQTNPEKRINQIIESTPQEIKLKIQTSKGYHLINPNEILYCKASGFYTELILTGDRVELCYLLLAKLEKTLSQYNFLRVSRSYLINEKYIRKIQRTSNTITLSVDGKEYTVKGSKLHIRNLTKLDID